MYHFCTYFDRNYLIRGLTLYRSLVMHCDDFRLYILCLDDEAYSLIVSLNQEKLVPIALIEMESWEKRLETAKKSRSLVEYFFTLSPIFPLFLFQRYPDIEMISYLDADLLFFSSPTPIFDELGDRSIMIIEHRFPPELKSLEISGRFNVQNQIFRNDAQGIACLNRWRDQCLEWCFDRFEDGKFADQKYLDEWPDLYDRLVILQHKGAGVAPWNWSQYSIEINQDTPLIDKQPLIFYHYHGLTILSNCLIIDGTTRYVKITNPYQKFFYGTYIKELKLTIQWLRDFGIQWPDLSSYSDPRLRRARWKLLLKGIFKRRVKLVC